ncbi:MAG: ABC transporter ATP-binding protein [Candidatus Omnitrophica bacterium]|nr:ABC transporter ATP-binding protein [Candidatus Omnitrophota bacterium]
MTRPILEAVEVSKWYPKRGGVLRRWRGVIRAVDGVSCSLQSGERLGLVGESGCGKTTLAKLLVGLLAPTRGSILLYGESPGRVRGRRRLAARRAVQMIFQNPTNSLNPRMSVEDTLSEPLLIHRLAGGRADRRRRVAELLDAVQLPVAYSHRLPRELSGGERQRVGIARALALQPEALICDEPIASLDVSVGAQIVELLRRLCQQRRMALVFISHDLRVVASLCERIAVMSAGRILERAPTQELLDHPRHPYTEVLIRSAELDLDHDPAML